MWHPPTKARVVVDRRTRGVPSGLECAKHHDGATTIGHDDLAFALDFLTNTRELRSQVANAGRLHP